MLPGITHHSIRVVAVCATLFAAPCAATPQNLAPAHGVTPAPCTAPCAWWETITLPVAGSAVDGIPIVRISGSWTRASSIITARLPGTAIADLASLGDSTIGFSRDGDFNRDGIIDRAIVGVFENRRREAGRFLVILSPAEGPARRVIFVAAPIGDPGFSVLRYADRRLTWSDCLYCDSVAEVVFDGARFALQDPFSGAKRD